MASLELPTIVAAAASEGIPVAAIARLTRTPSADIYEILHDALAMGTIADMPRADWPPGSRINDHVPCSPARSDADLAFLCTKVFRLTALEAGFMVALIKGRHVEKSKLHMIVEHQRNTRPNQPDEMEATDPKMVDVMICKLRKKLKVIDKGVEIKTIWGTGYYIETDVKSKIITHLNGEDHAKEGPAASLTNGDPTAKTGGSTVH